VQLGKRVFKEFSITAFWVDFTSKGFSSKFNIRLTKRNTPKGVFSS
jgi:hypothetical protein